MDEARRLKRGLKDISPLFEKEKAESPLTLKPIHPPGVQSLGVFCPQDARQNLFLNTSVACRMKQLGHECAMITIDQETKTAGSGFPPQGNPPLKHFKLTLSQLDEACRLGAKNPEHFGSSVLFFDFNYSNPIHFKKIIPIMDKWVLFLGSELESLTEAFKFIKASAGINRNLEYFIAYEGIDSPKKAVLLYERFSEIVSRRIGVSINWMGSFDRRIPASIGNLSMEGLQAPSAMDTIEKRALAGWVGPETGF